MDILVLKVKANLNRNLIITRWFRAWFCTGAGFDFSVYSVCLLSIAYCLLSLSPSLSHSVKPSSLRLPLISNGIGFLFYFFLTAEIVMLYWFQTCI